MRFVVLNIMLLFGSTTYAQQLKEITNSIGMKLVLIPPGSFTMGCPIGGEGRYDTDTRHEVTKLRSYD